MRKRVSVQYYDSPCGKMLLASIDAELCLCDWAEKPCAERNKRRVARLLSADFYEEWSSVLRQTTSQLDEYFAGERRIFDISICSVGTDFQRKVWDALLEIPYGKTMTYKEIARKVDNLSGIRAVAQAIGANGISIIIPCHRVIGSDGSLTGYAGGLDAKRMLLRLENAIA